MAAGHSRDARQEVAPRSDVKARRDDGPKAKEVPVPGQEARQKEQPHGKPAAVNEPCPACQQRPLRACSDTDPLKKYAWFAPALRDLPEAYLLTSAEQHLLCAGEESTPDPQSLWPFVPEGTEWASDLPRVPLKRLASGATAQEHVGVWVMAELPGIDPLELPLAFVPKPGDSAVPRLRETRQERPARLLVTDRILPAKSYGVRPEQASDLRVALFCREHHVKGLEAECRKLLHGLTRSPPKASESSGSRRPLVSLCVEDQPEADLTLAWYTNGRNVQMAWRQANQDRYYA